MIPIFDAHLDLAWNAVSFDRDLTLDVRELRRREAGMTDEPGRGRGTVTLPELRRAGVRTCVATILARSGPQRPARATIKRSDPDYATPEIAHAAAHAQLGYYGAMERAGHLRLIRTARELDDHWRRASADPSATPLGVILSMEGADPIIDPGQAEEWWDHGVRAIGLAHYGQGRYAFGTGTDGPLPGCGVALLRELSRLGMILDVTHLSDESMRQALDVFDTGPVIASHHNCRALVPGDRQLSDEQVRRLVARGAVIGAALDAWMLYPGWVRGQTRPEVVSLQAVADHIDHICQMAGDAHHCGIGSDLDGGFGAEQTPHDLDTIADLQRLDEILRRRGYGDEAVAAIFHGNWLRFFSRALPPG